MHLEKKLTCSGTPERRESQAILDHDLCTSRVNLFLLLLVEMRRIKLLPKRL